MATYITGVTCPHCSNPNYIVNVLNTALQVPPSANITIKSDPSNSGHFYNCQNCMASFTGTAPGEFP